ncbi:MAG TPA: MAPEG family protein [Gammaproteobacteria bacterium]
MRSELILQPFSAMLLLTLAVWLRLYFTRIPEMRRQRVHPQKLATRAQKAGMHLSDAEARASDNFVNLFELPVIFYALCLALYATSQTDAAYLVIAWGFVALRIMHSIIHLSYNKVLHRFFVYAAGGLMLFAGVLRFSIQLFV